MELFPIYDENVRISSNIWYSISGVGESPFMRVGHTVVHITNNENDKGKFYFIGGANPSGSFNDVYVFDLNTLAWDKYEDMKNFEQGRYEHACFKLNNSTIYCFGGSNESETINDLIRFDLNEKQVEKIEIPNKTCQPSPRTQHMGCTYKNQLVIFGGGLNGKTPVNDQNLYIFNPVNNKWISLDTSKNSQSKIPSKRHGHIMINSNDDFIYLHGGMNDDSLFDDLWVLDLKSLSWKQIDLSEKINPCERAAHGGISIDSNLFIFGGIGKSGTALDDLWKYDTIQNQWTSIEIFGYKPSSRLDFAYCKATFKNMIRKSNENFDELNSLDEKLNQNQNITKRESNEIENRDGNSEIKDLNIENELENKDEEAMSNFLVIHGGMDTQGNIFDDLFMIKLD